MAVLTHFYRDGKPVPLTATYYDARAGLRLLQAKGALQRLERGGLVRRCEVGNRTLYHVRSA